MRPDLRWLAGVVLAWVLWVAAAAALAPWLHAVLDSAPLRTVDAAAAAALQAGMDGATAGVMRAASLLFGHVPVLAFAGALALLLARRRADAAAWLLACVPLGVMLNAAVKLAVQRPRPDLPYTYEALATFSFPSGHAVQSTLLAGWLVLQAWPRLRGRPAQGVVMAAAVATVALVAASRVALGVHHFSDCVAGIVQALLWLAWCTATAPAGLARAPAWAAGGRTGA